MIARPTWLTILPEFTHRSILYVLVAACLTMLLSGCAEMPASIPQGGSSTTASDAASRLPASAAVEQANAFLSAGNKRDAASAYFAAAGQFESPDRERLILQAAELAASFRDADLTRRYLAPIASTPLNSENEARYRLIQGQLAINDRDYVTALRLMPHRVATLPEGLGKKILETRQYAARASGDKLVLVQELVLQEPNLLSDHEVDLNHQRIWGHLKQIPLEKINQGRREYSHPVLRGWLELAYLTRLEGVTSDKQAAQIALWKKRFPNHPGEARLNELFGNTAVATTSRYQEDKSLNPKSDTSATRTEQTTGGNATMTVLLPLSGQHSTVGNAILAGIKAAQSGLEVKQRPSDRTQHALRIVDSGSADIHQLYQQAVSSGAQIILGPFDKKRLAQLAQHDLSVPTLGLNYLGDHQNTRNLYQFGLLPEDEAVQIAQHAINRGHKKLAILTPDSAWGDRLNKTLKSAVISRGGSVVLNKSYAGYATSFSYIQSLIAVQKETLDAVLLIATPKQARAIYPALREKAPDLPVFATSHVYSGIPDIANDAKLDELQFCEIPWILNPPVSRPSTRFPRLFAMGLDAYALAQKLDRLQNSQDMFDGATGRIRLSSEGTLHRTLQWATFKQGRVSPF